MAISDYNKDIKEIIDSGMEYLEENDLDGFYQHVCDEAIKKDGTEEIISGIWKFMEDCGIFLIGSNTVDEHSIPSYYNYGREPSGQLITSGVLHFPRQITRIQKGAFKNSFGYNEIDLTGIEYIMGEAFQGVKGVKKVKITNDLKMCKTSAFYPMDVDTKFLIPEDADDFIKRCFANKPKEFY